LENHQVSHRHCILGMDKNGHLKTYSY